MPYRLIFKIVLVGSHVALAVVNFMDGNIKTGILGVLFAICNAIIFCWPEE
jgi:hypothetical protein